MAIFHSSLTFYVNTQGYRVWYSVLWKYFRPLVSKMNVELTKDLHISAFLSVKLKMHIVLLISIE